MGAGINTSVVLLFFYFVCVFNSLLCIPRHVTQDFVTCCADRLTIYFTTIFTVIISYNGFVIINMQGLQVNSH